MSAHLTPAVRDLLTAVRATLYTPYLHGPHANDAIITARAVLGAVLLDGIDPAGLADYLFRETAEEVDAGRVRYADRVAIAYEPRIR